MIRDGEKESRPVIVGNGPERRLRLHAGTYTCERCLHTHTYRHYLGTKPRYCPNCHAQREEERAQADRIAARERSRRRRAALKKEQRERDAAVPALF